MKICTQKSAVIFGKEVRKGEVYRVVTGSCAGRNGEFVMAAMTGAGLALVYLSDGGYDRLEGFELEPVNGCFMVGPAE